MSFLTSDEAVVAFQKYFGVVSIGNSASEKHCNDTSRHSENNGLDANRVTSPGHTYRLRNRVIPLQQQKDSASQKIETEQAHTNGIILDYEIRSYFWFYLFTFGAALANEVFFMIFLPLCCWNVTMLLPRRIVYTWMILFYLGQGSKDVVKIPRPTSPPVIRLDTTQVYMKEYGMPSTHAMLGIGLIGTIMYTFVEQYEFPVIPALVICFLWVALVCASRLYLGMHNVMDIVIGLIFAAVLMAIYVPFFDVLDDYFAFHPNVVWNVLLLPSLQLSFIPTSPK
ncbi:sphingosine-1-phosphate phosphatase 2-like [Saccoglossus kowalevskii]|uniref:Sphingosine-1-phosphate phosphatase 2-like n=1 Tax=Saccoglossus kowalevskii TaxID=10224 RepID=A0ABM0MFN6_SACKO|nr:PREDICTED: sphingosine-1-phosphate phosphatase 2-like [Saccoglossus kowalevskii]